MYGLISVPAAQGEIRTLPLEQHSMTQLPTAPVPRAALLKYHCRTRAGGGGVNIRSFLQPGKHAHLHPQLLTTVWSRSLRSLLLSSASAWRLKPCMSYTCLAQTFKDLRRKKKKCGPDVTGESPSQQQLDYWQQHMQHVSS